MRVSLLEFFDSSRVYSEEPHYYGHIKISGVYLIALPTDQRVYVGSTGDYSNRYRGHLSALRLGNHYVRELQAAYNRSDVAPSWQCVHFMDDREAAFDAEQMVLDRYFGTGLLFNYQPNARSSAGYVRGEEHSERTRQMFTGRVLTQEHRQSISAGLLASDQRTIRSVTIAGQVYPSIVEAADKLGLPRTTVLNRVKQDFRRFPDWKYTDET